MGLRWESAEERFQGQLSAIQARQTALEARCAQLVAEWAVAQAALEDLHRRNLNTIRSLRRLAALESPEGDEEGAGASLELGTADELAQARKRYGGG